MFPATTENYSDWIHPPLRQAWFLTGPTSSGKTPLAIAVAQRLNAEIISLDSMAIYRGMDIGTAKPTPEQRQQVPHYMLDVIEPTESFSVSSYVLAAHQAAADIRARGKRVLVCGGTPLYLKSLIRGLFLGPQPDWEFRTTIETYLSDHGGEALQTRLMQVDPLLAHKLHPHDHRRMIRALEVAKVTGQPLSHWQQQFETPADRFEFPVAVLKLDRAWLHQRINQRVEAMLSGGLVDEVDDLVALHGQLGRTAAQAVGYREVLELQRGEYTLPETVARIQAHTRQFARRQEIWFRGLQELQAVALTPESNLEQLADQIAQIFTAQPETQARLATDKQNERQPAPADGTSDES